MFYLIKLRKCVISKLYIIIDLFKIMFLNPIPNYMENLNWTCPRFWSKLSVAKTVWLVVSSSRTDSQSVLSIAGM